MSCLATAPAHCLLRQLSMIASVGLTTDLVFKRRFLVWKCLLWLTARLEKLALYSKLACTGGAVRES